MRPRWALPRVDHPVRGVVQLVAVATLLSFFSELIELRARQGHAGPLPLLAEACLAAHVALFVVSIAYHCVPWPPVSKARMRRVDHSMIYVKIAGSVGPFAWLAMEPAGARLVIAAAWGIALLGIAQKVFLPEVHPKHSSYAQVFQALLMLPCLSELIARDVAGTGPFLLVATVCYAVGGVVFLLERPKLWPRRYSFHELFHTLLLVGGLSLGIALMDLVRLGA